MINKTESGAADELKIDRGIPVKCLRRTRAFSSKMLTQLIAQLRCLYTTICSMGEIRSMEVTVQMQSYALITNIETWWDKSHD